MGKGSSGTKTTYTSSPEQQQMYGALLPMINAMAQQGVSQMGQGNYGMPSAPTSPSMSGTLTGVPQYEIPNQSIYGYNVGSVQSPGAAVAPTSDWWNSMSPEIKQGAWAPYQEGALQLEEQLGSRGLAGGARSGYSGAMGAALGNYYSDAANKYATGLWGMSQPGMMQEYQTLNNNALTQFGAQNSANQYLANAMNTGSQNAWQAQLGQNITGYQQGLTEQQTNYNNQLNQQQQDYAMQKTAWGLPWALTGMMPSTYSQGITTQPSSPYGGMFGGMLTGGLMGGMMGQQSGNTGMGAAGGGILGGLSGAMGGK